MCFIIDKVNSLFEFDVNIYKTHARIETISPEKMQIINL
jgi:hypothetical protein